MVWGRPSLARALPATALADAFRSDLLRASPRGKAFVVETGRPVSMERAERHVNWPVFAQEYAAMKWPHLAPNSRGTQRGH